MLIHLKQSIKTTYLLLLFIAIGTYLQAGNSQFYKIENDNILINVSNCELNVYTKTDTILLTSKDTAFFEKSEPSTTESTQDEPFSIPIRLAKLPINFRINSSICYLNFNHFVGNESRKMFFQAWLKEKELQKLSLLTDSLRKTYSNSSLEQKEEIAAHILKAEELSISLNEDIPQMYQKARDEEDRYWQTASQVAIMRFQEKITQYNDSIAQSISSQTKEESTTYAEISDTIILKKPTPQPVQKTAVTSGDIIYKIQIGAYKGKIPDSANKLIKKISILRKIENQVDDKGMKVYTTGHLRLYPEAVTMLGQVKQEGIKNAVIIAYQNGKKTTVMEARKLNNEL